MTEIPHGHYDRNLTTTSGDVAPHVSCRKQISFKTVIMEDIAAEQAALEKLAYVR